MSDLVGRLEFAAKLWDKEQGLYEQSLEWQAAREISRLTAENESLRGSIVSLLKMPAACTKDEEVIENVNRRKLALDLIGGHRVVKQTITLPEPTTEQEEYFRVVDAAMKRP